MPKSNPLEIQGNLNNRGSDMLRRSHRLPIKPEAGEILAESICIVGCFAIFPRGGEQPASSVGKSGGFTANMDDEGELRLVE